MTGELPADETVARAFAEIVLEAVTNAAKHAQARHVSVRLQGRPDGESSLVVRNAGDVPDVIGEGTGIPGMRRVAESVGATLSVSAGPPFVVKAVLLPRDGGAVAAREGESVKEAQGERGLA